MEIDGTKRDLENMVERVARHLRFVMYGVPDSRPLDAASPWLTYAKTAIRAMREPTEAMINNDDLPYSPGEMVGYWHTMIDAALGIKS